MSKLNLALPRPEDHSDTSYLNLSFSRMLLVNQYMPEVEIANEGFTPVGYSVGRTVNAISRGIFIKRIRQSEFWIHTSTNANIE